MQPIHRVARPIGLLLLLALIPAAKAQTSERASLGVTGAEGNNISFGGRLSADGRFVVFETQATNLIPGDSNANRDVLVRDRWLGTTAVISLDDAGSQGSLGSGSHAPDVSADGRFVVFHSFAGNFGAVGDTTGVADVFVRDRDPDANGSYDEAGSTTTQVSLDLAGAQPNGGSMSPRISDDATVVAFDSAATDLVAGGGAGGQFAVYARDLAAGTNELISVSIGGTGTTGFVQDISEDGRFVLFFSNATTLVAGDANGFADVFVRDRAAATTTKISTGPGGAAGNGNSAQGRMSADGRYVVYYSRATNLVSGGTANALGIFLCDRDPDGNGSYDEGNAVTELVSKNSFEVETAGNIEPLYAPTVTDDGRYVAFTGGDSSGSCCDLVPEDVNNNFDVFIRDRTAGTTTRVSVDDDGAVQSFKSWEPDFDADGDVLAFGTWSALASGDANTHQDVYVRDQTTWRDLAWNMAGSTSPPPIKSVPVLTGHGTLEPGSACSLRLVQATKGALCTLVAGTANLSTPFYGGMLVPSPDLAVLPLFVSSPATAFGGFDLAFTWPVGVPAGFALYLQVWVADTAGPHDLVSSNGLVGTTP